MLTRRAEDSVMYSTDNKNKLRISSCTLAVDRRCKVSRYFPSQGSPNLLDHNFPTLGYLITPAGYIEMVPPSPSEMAVDNLGRQSFWATFQYFEFTLSLSCHDEATNVIPRHSRSA